MYVCMYVYIHICLQMQVIVGQAFMRSRNCSLHALPQTLYIVLCVLASLEIAWSVCILHVVESLLYKFQKLLIYKYVLKLQ